jgi:outer membrane protein assembly factor BamB
MDIGPDGLLYVSALNHNDTRFGSWGVYRFIPHTGEFLGRFIQGPIDWIGFGPNGNLYGVDSFADDLVEYDRDTGTLIRAVLTDSVGNFEFVDGRHVFAVTQSSKIARYDIITGTREGPITDLAELGFEDYGFDRMALSPNGELYVAYDYRNRDTVLPGGIMRFDTTTGEIIDIFLDDIPAFGAANGGILGVAFGPEGDLYIGSQHAKAVLRFDRLSGMKIREYATPGSPPSSTFIEFLPVPEPTSVLVFSLATVPIMISHCARQIRYSVGRSPARC